MALTGADQARAIAWAQWRALLNHTFRRSGTFANVLTLIFILIWYGLWGLIGVAANVFAASPDDTGTLARILPTGLMLMMGYWQIVPVLMASGGLSLDLRRLLVYPIPRWWLFGMEVALRISTSLEMIFVISGLALGLSCNPLLPWWSALPLVPFTLLNLFLAAGLRDLFSRWMSRKYYREAMVFVIVLIAALPQALLLSGVDEKIAGMRTDGFGTFWPWSATATLLVADPAISAAGVLLAWTAAAWWFGRSQFQRSLRFDASEAQAITRRATGSRTLVDRILSLPSRFLHDPFAALLEKELRFLSRAPRFRLLFLMGFSFGLLIWLPLAFSRGDESAVRSNYLTIVSAYALMLLGEVCFWNSFGLDRSAAQTYFVMPVRLSSVLVAKNIAAVVFIVLELGVISFFCWLLRLPVTPAAVAEAFASTAVLTVFMLAAGNLLSVRYPRPVDPVQSWRSGSMGRAQAYLLFIYPLAGAPVLLAYGARYAFDTSLALYAVLAVDLLAGAIVYAVALESAVATAKSGRERMLEALSTRQGPVAV